MKVDIKYINRSKPRKTMSSSNFKPDTVYPAHSLDQPNFVPYVPKRIFDGLVQAVKDNTAEAYIEGLDG